MRFEYTTTFFPVEYETKTPGLGIFMGPDLPNEPDETSLIESEDYQEHMREMGSSGWELVTVQPLLRGTYTRVGIGPLGYSLTAGFYFFCGREPLISAGKKLALR